MNVVVKAGGPSPMEDVPALLPVPSTWLRSHLSLLLGSPGQLWIRETK